jgi:organizing structure protein 2
VTEQVRRARRFLYTHALTAENGVNDVLSRVLQVENACADAVASLAPPPESGEQLLPGSIYVVVSAMAGAIGSRNRGILLRTTMPLAFGVLAARMLLPVTMQNVADRGWEWEKKNAPGLAEQHLRLRHSWDHTWSTGVAHSHMARSMMEEKIRHGRETLEKWVREGR